MTHRLLFLDDLTERDLNQWRGDVLAKEIDRTLEYTLLYKPDKDWSVLAGVKLGQEYDSDVNETDLTSREIYLKIGYDFKLGL